MKKSALLMVLGFISVVLTVGMAPSTGVCAGPIQLNWAAFVPNTNPPASGVQQLFIDKVNERAKGELVIKYARQADPAGRRFAIEEFKRIAEPLAEAIGSPIEVWPCSDRQPSCAEQWSELGRFWRAYATVDLLNDVLTRLHYRDRKWYELGRLAHARDKLAKLF